MRRLVMDEFLHKGTPLCHRDHGCRANPRPVGGHGVSRAAIRPFEQPGERCQQIEAVAMDMNTAFDLEVKQHCPQAEVVYDLFHGGLAMAERWWTGASGAGECTESDKPARKVVKSARWLLLRNRAKLSEKQDVKLQWLAANQPLAMVYVLKEGLKGIWYAPSVGKDGDDGGAGCGR